MEESFNPEVRLEDVERAELAVVIAHPGFKVIQKIFRSCVDGFMIDLANTPSEKVNEVLAKHRDSRVAAQLYTRLVNIINNEAQMYIATKVDTKPLDVTESLDIGEYSKETDAEEEPFF